jgi:quercetin dioxygenase-like cupin family protein
MNQPAVITVEDITNIVFTELRPGCAKGVLHEDAASQTGVYRIQPGSKVPTHLHSRSCDLFVGVKGEIEMRYEGQNVCGVLALKPGAFCSIPPGVRHEVLNPSKSDEAYFLLVHTLYQDFDVVPTTFRSL